MGGRPLVDPGVAELLDGLADDPDPDVREAVEAIRE